MTTVLHAGSSSPQVDADATDPFVLHGRRLRPSRDLADISRFSDEVWDLAPAMLKQHERRFILDFTRIPAGYRQVAKDLCHAMLSGPLPQGEQRPAVGTVRTVFTDYVRFLRWVDGRAKRLDALTGKDLEDFQRFLIATLPAADARQSARAGARKFWLWRKALPSDALRFDPLHVDGWGEPRARGGRENATARIPEEVLGPLFAWAMRFVDEFAGDILAADRRWRTAAPPAGDNHGYGQLPVLLKTLLDEHIAHHRPLPGWRGRPSTTAIAKALGHNRVSLGRYRHLIDEAAAIVGTTPETLNDQPILGRLDGRPWIGAILADHTEPDSLAALARHLETACYLVLAFLSGARDSEIKHLRRGGLTIDRDAGGVPYRWKMHSLAFKGEDDPTGVPAVWSIGEPAARAITVLEQLHPPGTEFLFARLEHSPGSKPDAANQALTSGTTNGQLNNLVTWINDYCDRHGRPDRIPTVNGRVWHLRNSQFRRTLAWFIARRPDGVIAGALAYRHHCIQVFEGYAGTSASGFRAEVESEQALARGEHLLAAIDTHEHTGLTGPAARRLEEFGARARFQGTVTCVHDHAKALCERARRSRGERLPDHGGCKPLACRNVALTPSNTAAWQREIDRIDQRLAARPLRGAGPPGPGAVCVCVPGQREAAERARIRQPARAEQHHLPASLPRPGQGARRCSQQHILHHHHLARHGAQRRIDRGCRQPQRLEQLRARVRGAFRHPRSGHSHLDERGRRRHGGAQPVAQRGGGGAGGHQPVQQRSGRRTGAGERHHPGRSWRHVRTDSNRDRDRGYRRRHPGHIQRRDQGRLPGSDRGRFAAAGGVVSLKQAQYDSAKNTLQVELNSSDAVASEVAAAFVASTGQKIGTLTNAGGGTFKGTFALPVNPQKIAIASSRGWSFPDVSVTAK